MTITLHWWMVPIVVIVVGYIWAVLIDDDGPFDVARAAIFLLTSFLAVGIVVGHFL